MEGFFIVFAAFIALGALGLLWVAASPLVNLMWRTLQ